MQVVPHITNEIIEQIKFASNCHTSGNIGENAENEICLIELGGTVGDIESSPFQEAIRQLKLEVGTHNMLTCLVTYIPTLKNVGEQKTKIAQHGFKDLRQSGLNCDMVIARSETELTEESRKKLAMFANLESNRIVSSPDLDIVFQLPMILEAQNISRIILKQFHLPWEKPDLSKWEGMVKRKRKMDK